MPQISATPENAMTTITRAYESEADASQAVEKLQAAGISDTQIKVIRPAQAEAAAADYLRAGSQLAKASSVEPFAVAMERGQTLVATKAAFGSGLRISQIMDDCNPATLETKPDDDDPFHRGTPMSFVLGMSVLSRNNPTPLSDFLGFSTKPRNDKSLTAIAGDELVDNNRPYKGLMGMPLLTDSSNTFFSRLGLPDLINEKMGDKTFGLPLLSNRAAPLSGAVGMPTLSDGNKSPSSSFGIPTLVSGNGTTPADPPSPDH
jgi:hypothetical protein